MCEMIVLNAKMPIDRAHQKYFLALIRKSYAYFHGAGIALLGNNGATERFKYLGAACDSPEICAYLLKSINYRTLIAHARITDFITELKPENVQPFAYQMPTGEVLVFAHNGGLENYEAALQVSPTFPRMGSTDSEWAFRHVLTELEKRSFSLSSPDDLASLHNAFRKINECGSFNCFMAHGRRLYAYQDKDDSKSLMIAQCGDIRQVKLPVEEPNPGIIISTRINEKTKRNFEKFAEKEKGNTNPEIQKEIRLTRKLFSDYEPFMPMDGMEWKKMAPGQMAVFSEGGLIYESS